MQNRFMTQGTRLYALAVILVMIASACASAPQATPAAPPIATDAPGEPPKPAAQEIVVYVSDLPSNAFYEWEIWDDSTSPGGKMAGVENTGEELDPPPENDPHVTFDVAVQSGIPYRCWIHMKVGPPEGVSQANKIWVQFSDALDSNNQAAYKPNSGSYLTAQGHVEQGWTWVPCDLEGMGAEKSQIAFQKNGDITVRLQAGMEGVGFDQFLLSSALYLSEPPTDPVVSK